MIKQNFFSETYHGVNDLVKKLRGPDGCPWDQKQTPDTLKHLFLEECYELIEAIEEDNTTKLIEELGDVFFHLVTQIQIAKESERFTQEDVFSVLLAKLVHRHPHVFGDAKMDSASEVMTRWDVIKREELVGSERSILDGIPKSMPALSYAQSIQGRASRMGFDWNNYAGVIDKVAEEALELDQADSVDQKKRELGDLFFSLVNAARWLGAEAEETLRQTNSCFYERFTTMERLCKNRGLNFVDLPIGEKELLWGEVKAMKQDSLVDPSTMNNSGTKLK